VKNNRKIFAVFFMLIFCACGYHLVGKETHLPEGVSSIAIDTANNKTMESGLEQNFTQELILTFKTDGRVPVADKKTAPAILHSDLIKVIDAPMAFDHFGRANLIQITFTSRVYLVQAGTGKELWSSGIITQTEQYPVGDDFLANDRLRRQALAQACRRAAGIAVDQLASGF
jgi:outer membrane lipopolysaccharide assembly protein LptE/RlpB